MNITRSHMRVQDLAEVKSIIKKSYAEGNELDFQQTQWNKHSGELICTSHIRNTEFELTLSDTEMIDGYRHITVEAY